MRKKFNFIVSIVFCILDLMPFIYDIFHNRSIWMYGWLILSMLWFFIAIYEIVKYHTKKENNETTNGINNENIG
jgi:hypothetical protein